MPYSRFWRYDGLGRRPAKRKLKRFVKGSKEAKRYMRQMRQIRKGTLKERRRTYRDGLY